MLTSIRLGNFKCFETLEVKPARITVFIGPNGTGKSSVLHALMLLRQSLGSDNFRFDGPFVNLLNFQETVFAKDSGRQLHLELGGAVVPSISSPALRENHFSYEVTANAFYLIRNAGGLTFDTTKVWAVWALPEGEKVEPAQYPFKSTVIHFRSGRVLGSPIISEVVTQGDTSRQELDQATRLHNAINGAISGHIGRYSFVPAIRGFARPRYGLASEPITEIGLQKHLDDQGRDVASTLEMEEEIVAKVSTWIDRVTGVTISTATEPQQQVGVRVQSPGSAKKIYVVNEGFATNALVFLMFQLAKTQSGGMVGIEEPEIHLHPAAQTKLADLFVQVSKQEEKQLILTTHSEHILFALLNNVAEGTLTPEELAVYAFERPDGAAACRAKPLEVTKEGMVKGGIPGFFEANLDAQRRHLEALTKLAGQG